MKYISIILLSLFIVGNVNATAYTIKDVCEATKTEVLFSENARIGALKRKVDAEEYQDILAGLSKMAKVYHYLDCREELGG